MRSLPVFTLLCSIGVFGALTACGSDSTDDDDDANPSSSSSSSSGGTPLTDATVDTAFGACHFAVKDGEQRTSFEWKARARMNGSGNLLVRCDDGGEGELVLNFGNATFDGPRTYLADDFSSDGSVTYSNSSSDSIYMSTTKGASCSLVLVEAGPLDARGDSVEKGGTVAATFTCSALLSTSSEPPSVGIESGSFKARIE